MNRRTAQSSRLFAVAITLFAAAMAEGGSSDAIGRSAAWRAPRPQDVRAQAAAWLDAKKPDSATRAKAEAIWLDLPDEASEDELLSRLAHTFALGDSNAAKLVAVCSRPRDPSIAPNQAWLADSSTAPLFAANLRLFYSRWLLHNLLFDEAQEQLSGLTAKDVVAPASLLFCQSVIGHALLDKESGMKSIGELLEREAASPRRYVALAKLMQEDLKALQEDTLDHIARRMNDIRRRLDLGHAGPKVRTREDGVIASLDKMIKKLEEQQQEQEESRSGSDIRGSCRFVARGCLGLLVRTTHARSHRVGTASSISRPPDSFAATSRPTRANNRGNRARS